MAYQDGLRHAFVALDPLAALRAPTTALLGVTESTRTALADIGLATIFDLATAPLFGLASQIADAAQGGAGGGLSRFEQVPGGVGAPDSPTRLVDFAAAPLSAIRSLGPEQAQRLEEALQVDTVADLGRWPPYHAALAVLDVAGGAAAAATDEGSELAPRLGEFPTERRYFSTIVMDRVAVGQTVDLATAGPVDISPTIAADFGFSAPALGARLTFEQSWFAHGVTLGNLLHSVALAPGESTRIAVVDWSRQTRATGAETIGETEALTNDTAHNRAVSEVQDAVANEVQSGFSHTESTASTSSGGAGFGLGLGPLTVGGSGSTATTSTSGDSFSSSAGSRSLSASMSQQVMDATHQAASSVRNRRATIVKEISETEHEAVSTRILANYNHMHALTVQYFEVIEIYRVAVGLHEAERCLFVPMKLADFDEKLIARYQGALAAAALDRRARELLTTDFGMVRLFAAKPMRPFTTPALDLVRNAAARAATLARATAVISSSTDGPPGPAPTPPPPPAPPPAPPAAPPPPAATQVTWVDDEIRRASRIAATAVLRPGDESVLLPRDALLEGLHFLTEGGPPVTAVTIRRQSGLPAIELTRTSIGFLAPPAIPLDDLLEIVVTTPAGTGRSTGSMTLELAYNGAFFPLTLPVDAAAGTASVVARTGDTEAGPELIEHLRANRLHYNQAIWRSFDASTVALLLSRYTFEGVPVADLIDPRPIQVAGNYLVFRMPGFVARASLPTPTDDRDAAEAALRRSWAAWLEERGLTFAPEARQELLVPVPTGGVFAEAVLGRSNSAEKLDMTRFWNWQDSPIPLQPPEIAAISLGSRAQPVDVTPGQLGQPVLNIVSPASLPDPTGLGAMLGALQAGSMFRDMSGLAATIGLAQSTAGEATSAANEAGKLAAANLAVAAQKEIELAKIAAAAGSPTAMQGTPKNISESGALLNTASALDAKKAGAAAGAAGAGSPAGSGASGGGGGTAGGAGGSSGGGEPIASNSVFGSSGSGSLTDAAFNRAAFGALGAPVAGVLAAAGSGLAAPGSGGQPLSLPIAPVGEIFFYADVRRVGDLDTFEKEIAALAEDASPTPSAEGTWHPASPDFRAISLRSNNFTERSDARISSLDEFYRMLAEPAVRFNFFSYMKSFKFPTDQPPTDPPAIALNLEVTTTSATSESPVRNGIVLSLLTIANIQQVRQLVDTGSNDPLAESVRRIRAVNAQIKDVALDESGLGLRRQLWLYVCSMNADSVPDERIATELASLVEMDVFMFDSFVTYHPQLQLSPRDQLRGRVTLLGDADLMTQNVHTLDELALKFP